MCLMSPDPSLRHAELVSATILHAEPLFLGEGWTLKPVQGDDSRLPYSPAVMLGWRA